MVASLCVAAVVSLAACVAGEDEAEETGPEAPDCSDGKCDVSSEALCSWKVEGKGLRDVETDYLPRVVTCENGDAPLEALKAQAIAARSYLYYVARVERRAIKDSQGDQVYGCGREPSAEAIEAVRATAGQILTYRNTYVAAFFVAGAIQPEGVCTGGTTDPTRTEKWVTYNRGLSGDAVKQCRLGYVSKRFYSNRGAMSQNGAACWAALGSPLQDILTYYYGEDIELTQMQGSCVR